MPWLRTAYLAAAVVLLTALPVSQSSVLLALFVAVDLAAAALFWAELPARPQPRIIVSITDDSSLQLWRRTVPQLRGRRPGAIIDAQVSWRQAAEFRRRREELRKSA